MYLIAALLLLSAQVALAQDIDLFGKDGVDFSISTTNIYQNNVHGGTSTHNRRGRFTGSYDLELTLDFEKLLGWDSAQFYIDAAGSYSDVSIDDTSIGSFFGTNADSGERRSLDVTEAWYQQSFFDKTLEMRVGKISITGGFECRGCPVAFDTSFFANDENSQFLNGALVNNPTIPFPDNGLGLVLHWNPEDSWYLSLGVADAKADVRETGFKTAFDGNDDYFYIGETGIVSAIDASNGELVGAYRVGGWIDGQDKADFDTGKNSKHDAGFYINCDQMLIKENNIEDDSQGLGVFARYGWANQDRNDMKEFWSFGLNYQGLFEGRDDDVLGVGFAHGSFSDKAGANDGIGFSEDNEEVCELYYNAQINDWLSISPDLQYVKNPGGNGNSDAVVLAVRARIEF